MSDGYQFNSQVGASNNGIGASSNTGTAIAKDNGIALAQGATLKTGIDFGPVSGGYTVTIGETGLGSIFASTVKDLNDKNNATLSGLVQNESHANLPNANADIPAPGDTTPGTIKPKNYWALGGGVAVVALVLWLLSRK